MPEENKSTLFPRIQAVSLLIQRFVQEYRDAVKDFGLPEQLEVTEHLIAVIDLLLQYAPNQDEAVYKQYVLQEEDLLKKYRKALVPYRNQHFHLYFDFSTMLTEKNIYPVEEYNRLTGEEQCLSLEEITRFAHKCRGVLYYSRDILYLQMKPEYNPKREEAQTVPRPAEPDKDSTKARQLLMICYLLKAGFGIESRSNASISSVARLAHVLTGTKITNLQNSDIYKKLGSMPNYKKGEQLIGDLRFIRPYFEELNLQEAVKLIDAEIQRAVNDLSPVIRKKYQS